MMSKNDPNRMIDKSFLSKSLPENIQQRFMNADVYAVDANSFKMEINALAETNRVLESIEIDNMPQDDLIMIACDNDKGQVLFCGFYWDCHVESGKGKCCPILPPELYQKALNDEAMRNDLHQQLIINKAILIILLSMRSGVINKKNSNNKLGIGTGFLKNGRCAFHLISAEPIPIMDQHGKPTKIFMLPHLRPAELKLNPTDERKARFYRPFFTVESLAYLDDDKFSQQYKMIRASEDVTLPAAKPSSAPDSELVHN